MRGTPASLHHMLFWQILIDGFAISALYALGATGFTLIFGVSGVLNLSHGAIMVAGAVAAWALESLAHFVRRRFLLLFPLNDLPRGHVHARSRP